MLFNTLKWRIFRAKEKISPKDDRYSEKECNLYQNMSYSFAVLHPTNIQN